MCRKIKEKISNIFSKIMCAILSGFKKTIDFARKYHFLVSSFVIVIVGLFLWHFSLTHLNVFDDKMWYANFFVQYPIVNWFVSCYAVFLALALIGYTCPRPTWHSMITHFFAYAIVCVPCYFIPALFPVRSVFWGVPYHMLICILLAISYLAEIGMFIYWRKHKAQEPKKNEPEQIGWEKYAQAVIDTIDEDKVIRARNECFAIGISSAWGSGKTTFLQYLRKEFENKSDMYCVSEFKPWQMTSPEQINKEFFKLFKSILEKESLLPFNNLSSVITKYANLLLYTTPSIPKEIKTSISTMLGWQEGNVMDLRNLIDDGLAKTDKRIVIFIDDLDRLEYEELFELLRLIRVSANFKNVIYVVAYDKDYVAKTLSPQIHNGEDYLKKIINLEIVLPTYEYYVLMRKLYRNLEKIINDSNYTSVLLNAMLYMNNGNYVCNEYFTNFRDVERFTNQFTTIIAYLKQQNEMDKFNLGDLFWLEVLHYFDNDIYGKLYQDYETYLQTKNNASWLEYKDEKEPNLIIKHLFPKHITPNGKTTIAWRNNFRSYFAYRQLGDTLSAHEFSTLLECQKDKSEFYNEVERLYSKSRNPHEPFVDLLWIYERKDFKNIKKEIVLNYARVILYLAHKQGNNSYVMTTLCTFFKNKYRIRGSKDKLQITTQKLFDEIRYVIEKYGPNECWNKLLTQQIFPIDEDSYDPDYPSYNGLLSIEELKQLAQLNWNKYIETRNSEAENVAAIFGSSEVAQFVSSSAYVKSTSWDGNKEIEEYSNLLPGAINSAYGSNKYGLEAFENMMDNLCPIEEMKVDVLGECFPQISKKVCELFGTIKSFNAFVDAHFDISPKTKDYYMSGYGLKVK